MAEASLSRAVGPGPFFEQVRAAFARAADAAGVVERRYDLLGRSVLVRLAGDALTAPLTAAIAHRLDPEPAGPPDLTFEAWDEATSGVTLPAANVPPIAYGAKGIIDGFNDDRFSTVFAPGVELFSMFDAAIGHGLFWYADAAVLPWWDRAVPFRTLLHWATAGTSVQLVHSGAVGIGDDAVLLTGASGSGKSTTSLLCLRAGLQFLGDDYVAFQLGEPPRIYSVYSSAKLDETALARVPELEPLVALPGTGPDKSLLFLWPGLESQLSSGQRLRAILLPRVTGGRDSRLVPASPIATVRALAPSTVFQLPRYDREAFQLVVELAKTVPSFHLELGTDLDQIPPLVAGAVAREA